MGVTINGVTLSPAEQWSLSLQLGVPIADGRYFYDHATGAWGHEGGPAVGLLVPGLPLPRRPSAPAPAPAVTAAPPLASPAASAAAGDVIVNGAAVDPARVDALSRQYGVTIRPGRYWYDRTCGAWGLEGGPAAGLAVAGLDLGGPLRADASGGAPTGTFVNGRQLHPLDVQALARITQVYPGRYWLDAQGNGGIEGGPVLFNLAHLARQAQAAAGGPWSKSLRNADGGSNHVGGDGNGFFYFSSKDTSLIIG
jgi:hypothetical protein